MPAPDNGTIAERLESLAGLLDLAGASYYSVRAYRRAAELIRATPASVAELVRTGRVRELRDRLERLPRLARAAPAALLVGEPGERVDDAVQIGRDP